MPRRDECLTIVRQLWLYLDGALPEELQERVAQHLEECTNCRSHFDFARTFLHAIEQHGGVTTDRDTDALRIRVLGALAAANDAGH